MAGWLAGWFLVDCSLGWLGGTKIGSLVGSVVDWWIKHIIVVAG
jgi:hypothetical protein